MPRWRTPRRFGIAAGAVAFLLFFVSLWRVSFPPLPNRLTLHVTFAAGQPGQGEPLITTGRTDDGDFLAIRYLDAATAVILYDVWGVGGPTSAPFVLQPGQRRVLEVEMPTLRHVAKVVSRERRPLRVTLDGAPLLDETVFFHRRAPEEIFFATNPIGGTLVASHFTGRLATPAGRELQGGPGTYFSAWPRLAWLLRERWYPLLGYTALSVVIGFLAAGAARIAPHLRLPSWSLPPARALAPTHLQPPHRWFIAATLVCTALYVAMLTAGTFRLLLPDIFGDFYDHQARALLKGRLHLDEAARTSESFIFENRIYIYFGPTPAVLRLPLVFFDVAFGQLSRCFMVAYFLATLAGAYALQLHVARLIGGPRNWPSRFAVLALTVSIGLGSTVFFLAARTYVYHEAILCGIAFAVWSSYFSLRWLDAPARAWWLPALACGIASVHARPPTGLFALALVGTTALALGWETLRAPGAPSFSDRIRPLLRPFLIAVAAALGILSFNGLSYLKFKSFEGAPLRYHVEYQNNHRIAHIQGRNFHASNVRFNFDYYAWRPNFTVSRHFPYFYFHRPFTDVYPHARIDLAEPVLALPYSMPGLVFLALAPGAAALFLLPTSRRPLAVIAVAALPMTLALLAAVAISQRYTGDFVPPLLIAAAFGLQALPHLIPRVRRILRAAITLAVLLGVLVTFVMTLHYKGAMVWGVPRVQEHYAVLRKNIDAFFGVANPPGPVLSPSSAPPSPSPSP